MLAWFKRRREVIAAEADELMEAYGNNAYSEARKIARAAREKGDHRIGRFYGSVAQVIAKRTDFEIGFDTATRYLDEQRPYDHGPSFTRKPGVTLH